MNSFANELEGDGGLLLDHRSYQTGTQDFSIEIENLMTLTQSVSRYKRLRANLGLPLQFDPRRRQDVDFVFLAADAKAGRLIKSQLKFHYAGELPVYSTSFIYSMDGRSNSDLNGVMFADTPWIIAPPTWIAGYPQLYSEFWPAEKRMGRLHAMGYDAYNLVSHLYSSSDRLQQEYVGATGRLYLDSDGRVHRRLAWAQFERGELVPLPDTDELIELPDEDSLNGQPTEWPSHQLRQ
jgi:outer membrane PBP1 activator LpoA protein